MKSTTYSTGALLVSQGALLLAAALSSPASAAPTVRHVIPPTACQLRQGEQDNLVFVGGGLRLRPNSPDNTIQCNLPRDNPDSSNGLATLQLSFSTNNSGDLFCSVYSSDRWGTQATVKTADKSTAGGTRRTLTFNAGDLSMLPHLARGMYSLFCELPNDSEATLFSIYYEEN
jgi:hypothetical protein